MSETSFFSLGSTHRRYKSYICVGNVDQLGGYRN